MSQSAVEAFFEERWDEVADLVRAFREFEERAFEGFEKTAGPIVAEWLAERGFEVEIKEKVGEFQAYKTEWRNTDGETLARLAVGGLYPAGLGRGNPAPAPFLWVYMNVDKAARASVAARLRDGLGNSGWLAPDTNDRYPLGRYLTDAASSRLQLVRDPRALANFVVSVYPSLLQLSDRVTAAIRAV